MNFKLDVTISFFIVFKLLLKNLICGYEKYIFNILKNWIEKE